MFKKIFNKLGELTNTYEYIKDNPYIKISNRRSDKEREAIYESIPTCERYFSGIVGYEDIKKLLYRAIKTKHNVSYCLVGPPASAKSIFLQEIERQEKSNSAYIDGTGASGRGLVETLVNKLNIKYLLIDEIDKMTKKDVTVLYNVLETGRLTSTKKNFTFDQQFDGLRVFATSNSRERMPKPLLSRITTLLVPEYNLEEFQEINRRLLTKRFGLSTAVSDMISLGVWNKIRSKDIRKVITIAKLVDIKDTQQDIDWLIDTHAKHNIGESEFDS